MRSTAFKLSLMTVTAALLAACGGSANNSNTSRSNSMTNLGSNNANVGAVVVNSNVNSASNNTNRWSNANSVTREEYDKNRSDYEKDKGSSTIGTGANDSWLWFKTRAALLTTADLRDSTINVDVTNDVITLKGTVETAAQKTKAMQVANGIEGKKRVIDQLKVAPNDSMTNTGGSSNKNTSSNSNKK
jgi:osmotically-inducible protein OsmY